jgi:SpoIID/LytB domain protein
MKLREYDWLWVYLVFAAPYDALCCKIPENFAHVDWLVRENYVKWSQCRFPVQHRGLQNAPKILLGIASGNLPLYLRGALSKNFYVKFLNDSRKEEQHKLTGEWRVQVEDHKLKLCQLSHAKKNIGHCFAGKVFFLEFQQQQADFEVSVGKTAEQALWKRYGGPLVILEGKSLSSGHFDVVQISDIESILRGIVPAEMPFSAPMEALKAQAVISRSLMVGDLGKRHPLEPFHFCTKQHCQVYHGHHWQRQQSDLAVSATKGRVLYWNHSILAAVYSADCGGHTENNESIWQGQPPHPALRAQSDFLEPLSSVLSMKKWSLFTWGFSQNWRPQLSKTYCALGYKQKSAPIWRVLYSQKLLEKTLSSFRKEFTGEIIKLTPIKISSTGRILSLDIETKEKSISLVNERMIRGALGQLRSSAVDIVLDYRQKRLERMTLIGRGHGHGVGLCQRGAMGRAFLGATYSEILRHYYRDTEILKLW